MLRITVPSGVQATLRGALSKAGSRECGGVLMGEHLGPNHFAVRAATVQRPGAIAYFVRGVVAAARALSTYYRATGQDFRRFNYLGEWHSHPLFSVQPSSRDHATMCELATDSRVGANFVVLVIVRLRAEHQLEGSAHTYLPDGSVHVSHLELENFA